MREEKQVIIVKITNLKSIYKERRETMKEKTKVQFEREKTKTRVSLKERRKREFERDIKS